MLWESRMTELRNLRAVATALEFGPSFEKLSRFIADIDSGQMDPEKLSDAERIMSIVAKCTHIRGYQDLYIEGFELVEWATLLKNAANELRETFPEVESVVARASHDPNKNAR